MILVLQLLTPRRDGLGVMGLAYVVELPVCLSDTTDREAVALVVPILRIEERRVEVLVSGAISRVSMHRPVVAVQTPSAKASRVPDIAATSRKRKRFGDNTGIGSGGKLKNGIYENLLTKSLLFDIIEL